MSEVTESDFNDWKANPVTKLVYEAMKEAQDQMVIYLAGGGTLQGKDSPSTEYIVGRIQGISDFLLAEFDSVDSVSKEPAIYEH